MACRYAWLAFLSVFLWGSNTPVVFAQIHTVATNQSICRSGTVDMIVGGQSGRVCQRRGGFLNTPGAGFGLPRLRLNNAVHTPAPRLGLIPSTTRVSSAQQQQRDTDRRSILVHELIQAQSALRAQSGGNPQVNAASLARHREDVRALQEELARLEPHSAPFKMH
jgi:hypothetical protein